MTIDRRCKATFTRTSGQVLRCEHYSGHDSVHYNGDVWWPNKHGYPFPKRRASVVTMAWMTAVAVVLLAIFVYLLIR